ncbi:DUF2497 domain-containing protein [Aurantiacibacter spongiae]|uniref:DUF2497 domain-containing protein n=1 Tax=Aurantiacibacter spongiae TaxID=2488860 RepID=A0A3N5CVC0_9SPHN|nr:DUF2497 domain-containing protein [Aurantiacibacter spongiae]RPF71410.1 DUF2497 domain-containing protein [Aurantiacibacter spongiae]
MRQEGEPSVEEILDSIKKVIQRDNREAAQRERLRRETDGMDAADTDGDGAASPEPVDAEEADEILDLGELGSPLTGDDIAFADTADDAAGADEAYVLSEMDDGGADDDDDREEEPLTTDRAAEAMRQSLAALAMLADPPAKPQIVRSGETSLEGLVREMLRPMLAQWLDANLPEIVERQVRAEIARIAGKKR